MKHLKTIFACLLMAVLSIGQVWATDAASVELCTSWSQTFAYATAYTHDYSIDDLNGGTTTMTLGVQGVYRQANANTYFQMNKKTGYFKNTTALPGKITKIETTWSVAKGATKCYFANGAEATSSDATVTVSAGTSVTYTPDNAADYYFFNIDVSTGSGSAQMTSCVVYYEKAGGGSTPSVSVTPASWDFGTVHASAEASKVFSVSGSNLTAGDLTLTVPAGFSVSPSSISVDGTLAATNVTVSKNTSDVDNYEGNLEITGGGLENAKTVALTMTVDADPAPTGTFELFSGDIGEGDYVIVSANALSNTVNNNRIASQAVTVSDNKIVNPDAAIVWHIEANGDYWTLYNAEAEKYAGGTSTKNQGALLASVTDYAKWTITGSSTYEFENLGRATGSSDTGNKWLRYNSGNAENSRWACYSTGTGSALTLYKLSNGKEAAGLAYDAADAQKLVKVGGTLVAPTLTNPNSLAVTYASNNTSIAEVNETTGAVTIKSAAGVAVITASTVGDATHNPGSASYTIYVATEAGTDVDPLTEASAKALIDLGCGMDVYMKGTVATKTYYGSKTYTLDLAGGMQYYYFYKADGETVFESDELKVGDIITAFGTLKKVGDKYRLNPSYMVARIEYTEPLVDISNTKGTAYTVAEALELAGNPTSDLTKPVYIKGVVYDVKSFNQTNGTLDIYIKDEGVDNKFEFYKCAGIYDESLTAFTDEDDVHVGDDVIGYGVMKYFSGGSIWEFDNTATGDYLVDLDRPAVAVTGIDLTESTASVEVGSTVTLHASVVPGNATDQGIVWSVTSGSDKASVDENGVVTGVAEGTAVIRAASHEDATINAECTVTITAVDPTKHTVTFDATIDISDQETSITKGGITITASKFNNNEEGKYYYQCYASSAMTVSSTVGNITNIELTCTASGTAKYGPGNWDFTGYSYDGTNGSWAGSAETVEFGNASQQVRMTLITVTYKEDTRAESGLAWDPADDIEITVGDLFTAPTLLNPNSIDAAEISIESSNTDVATVTAGVVALVADATGEATITATFAGNASYKPATVSYKITVNPAYSIYVQPSLNVNFGSVNQNAEVADKSITVTLTGVDAATLTLEGTGASAFTISPYAALTASGDITISASSANIGTFVATLTISDDANNAESKVVNISITVNEVVTPETPVSTTSKWVPATEIADGMQVLIVGERNEKIYAVGAQTSNNRTAVEGSLSEGVFTPGENTMAFTVVAQEGGTYALQASNGKYLYAAGSGSGKNFLRSQDEVDANAKWTLSVSSATANGTNTNNKLQLNNSSDIFSCYSSTQKAIQFYVPKPVEPDYTTVRTGLNAGDYYTMCLDKAVTAVQGGSIWRVVSKADGSSDIILEEVTGNLDAGRPYIFLASAADLKVAYTGDAVGAPVNDAANNGLIGSFSKQQIAQSDDHYIIYNNALYYVNSDNVFVGAYRAYLDMTGVPAYSSANLAPGRRRVTMAAHGPQTATGIEDLNASEKPMKMMINGQIFILRGEKMYDTTGRLVK